MIKRFYTIIYIIICVLFQTQVIDNIHLFGVVTPFIYIYAVLKFPVDMKRTNAILFSFFLGLVIDAFSNTFGIHAAACTLIGFVRAPLLEQFVDVRELPEHSIPSYGLFGFGKFFRYALIMITLHHVILFSIESFGFYRPGIMIIRTLTSILSSFLLISIIEAFNLRKAKHGD